VQRFTDGGYVWVFRANLSTVQSAEHSSNCTARLLLSCCHMLMFT
jgi:hypothetical protein